MSFFDAALKHVLGVEGDYSDHPNDSGGKTRWGVTEYLARIYGYKGDMRDYPLEEAKRVYRAEFWDRMRLDEVASLSLPIAKELFEIEVNCVVGTAPTMLQRALNSLNRQGKDYPDLKVDGRIGPATLGALKAFLVKRGRNGEVALLRILNGLQVAYYTALAERREKNEDFYFGWILNRVVI